MTGKHVNLNNARTAEQQKALKQIEDGDFCPFCQRDYIEKEHKKPILKETNSWLATENRWPYEGASAHLLFIHKKHITSIEDMGNEAWLELKELLTSLKKEGIIPQGATLVMRFGDHRYTGGTVTHLHAQVISGSPDGGGPVLARVG